MIKSSTQTLYKIYIYIYNYINTIIGLQKNRYNLFCIHISKNTITDLQDWQVEVQYVC